ARDAGPALRAFRMVPPRGLEEGGARHRPAAEAVTRAERRLRKTERRRARTKSRMMPGRAEWSNLAKETFHAIDRRDVQDLYSVEWQQAKDELISEYRESIQAETRGW